MQAQVADGVIATPEFASTNAARLQYQNAYAEPASVTLTGTAGGEQTLTVTYTDTDGAGLIAYGQIIVNPNTGAASLPAACYLTWDSVGDIDLLDESQSPVGVYTGRAGQAGTAMSDGYCTVNPLHSSVTGSGTMLTVALAVTFPASFAGLHEVYSYGLNTAGLATGLIDLGAVEVQPPPDPPPPGYPNYITSLPAPTPLACNITGNWADSLSTGLWALTQPDNTVTGSLTVSSTACGSVVWSVAGTFASAVASLNATNPVPAVDLCGVPAGTNAASVLFSSCFTGQAYETASRPAYINSFQQPVPAQTLSGSGTWTLASRQLTFGVSPTTPILLSTGDTNVTITTTASNPAYNISNGGYLLYKSAVNPSYTTPTNQTSPASTCLAGLNLPTASGAGSATGALSTSPAGNPCSGIYVVAAAAGGTLSSNSTYVIVPPQVLMQGMYGEAHGQTVAYGSSDPDEQAIGVAIRNRLGDQMYFPGINATYQAAIILSQVNGLNTSLTSWTNPDGSPTAELLNAANVFDGASTISVDNAKCWFGPTAPQWALLQAALSSGTAVKPQIGTGDPGCFGPNAQFVYKTSISPNANRSGAPAFIFVQQRQSLTQPAAIQIP